MFYFNGEFIMEDWDSSGNTYLGFPNFNIASIEFLELEIDRIQLR